MEIRRPPTSVTSGGIYPNLWSSQYAVDGQVDELVRKVWPVSEAKVLSNEPSIRSPQATRRRTNALRRARTAPVSAPLRN